MFYVFPKKKNCHRNDECFSSQKDFTLCYASTETYLSFLEKNNNNNTATVVHSLDPSCFINLADHNNRTLWKINMNTYTKPFARSFYSFSFSHPRFLFLGENYD